MEKEKSISITPEEAKLLAESVIEKVRVLEKLEAMCLRENLAKAALPIKAQIIKLGELRERLVSIYLNNEADGYERESKEKKS